MIKFKLTTISGLTVEHTTYTLIGAIKYVENRYNATVVKAEMILDN